MTTHAAFEKLTVSDAMTRSILTIGQELPAYEAAERLLLHGVSGAPVIDDDGRCVGVFSLSDFARLSKNIGKNEELPECCPFQVRHRRVDGTDVMLCTLPPGVCPIQLQECEGAETRQVCQAPHEIVVEWQALQPKLSPKDPVKRWMSSIPITVNSSATLVECAGRMVNAKVHRLVIVDDDQHAVGLVTSMDILKTIAELAVE